MELLGDETREQCSTTWWERFIVGSQASLPASEAASEEDQCLARRSERGGTFHQSTVIFLSYFGLFT